MAHPTKVPAEAADLEVLRPERVAKLLGVSLNTLAIWRHYNRGPSFLKIGRQVRYPVAALNEFLADATRVCNPEIAHLRSRR